MPVRMIEDTGLQRGAADLRRQQLFLDFTIRVQDQEFRVHKFVLAAVSDYFRAMLSGSMSESMNDLVELKEINAEHVSKLIDYIYTGEAYNVIFKPKEMLELAVYFQMPTLIGKCKNNLLAIIELENCLDLLTTFKTYSMDNEVTKVNSFIRGHTGGVMRHYKVDDIPLDVVRIILDEWNQSEWDMFQFVQSWIGADFDNREMYTDDFMSRVRFSIMPPQHIKEIHEMDTFKGSWKDLVKEAIAYHGQTILQKVVNDSDQCKFRFGKTAFLLNMSSDENMQAKLSVLVKDKKKRSSWKTGKAVDSPQVKGKIPFAMEVNNFLITCSEFGENQTWQIFDPLTLTWTKMANMPNPRDAFAMVYHDRHLYVLGGKVLCTLPTRSNKAEVRPTDTIDNYSFETNSWRSTMKLPIPVENHCACVLNGAIYVSGGRIPDGFFSWLTDRMDCLDLSSRKWQSKAQMPSKMSNHKMSVVVVKKQEVIIVINEYLTVRYYHPSSDQWSSCDSRAEAMFNCYMHDRPYKDVIGLDWARESVILTDENTVYLLNVPGSEWRDYENDYSDEYKPDFRAVKRLCAKWRIVDEYRHRGKAEQTSSELDISKPINILQFGMADFPTSSLSFTSASPLNIVGGVLAFPGDALVREDIELDSD